MLPRKKKREPERYTIEDQIPDPLSDDIREQFNTQRRAMYPSAVQVARKHDDTFRKAAELCRSVGMTAGEFVRERLQNALARNIPPYPQCLLGQMESTSEQASLDKLNTYKAMLATFEQLVRLYGPRMILADPRANLSPLMRFALSRRYGLTELQELHAPAARSEAATLSATVAELFQDDIKVLHGL